MRRKKNNRYVRAARVIADSLIETGKLPTVAEIAQKGDMREKVASYCLDAWEAMRDTQVKVIAHHLGA